MCICICVYTILALAQWWTIALRILCQPIISRAMPKYEAVQVPLEWCVFWHGLPDEEDWYGLSERKCQMIDAPITQLTFRSNCQTPMGYANYRRSTSSRERARGLHRFTHDARLPQRPDILVRKPQVLKTTVHVSAKFMPTDIADVAFELKNEFGQIVYIYKYRATPGGRSIKVSEVHAGAKEELILNGEITRQSKMMICQPTTWHPLSMQKVLWQTKALIRRDQPNMHAVLARNVKARHE